MVRIDDFLTRARIQEFLLASIILSVLHWIVISVILKVFPTTFQEFFFSTQYLMFIAVMTIAFLVLEFTRLNLRIRETTLLRGLKYYIGFAFAVMFVLKEPLSITFAVVTILKVLITINILERF